MAPNSTPANNAASASSSIKNYCPEEPCQRARKAAWQRYKMKTDADYRTQQKLSNQKWVEKNPGYWTRYRQRNPDKAGRNRILQQIRNRRNRQTDQEQEIPVVAKMDARKSYNFDLLEEFYMVPVIAKMDVRTPTI